MKYLFYRWLMKTSHKFNWHYAPIVGPLEDGDYQRWCTWCGLRQNFTKQEDIERIIRAKSTLSKFPQDGGGR